MVAVSNEAHDYSYPKNPINPAITHTALEATKGFAYAAAAMIPLAVGHTVLRSVYQLKNGCSETVNALKRSVTGLGKPEGIIINTIAAPFAACACLCVALAQGDRR